MSRSGLLASHQMQADAGAPYGDANGNPLAE
jgi:hypothetical protein